jgi:hypothetical protein
MDLQLFHGKPHSFDRGRRDGLEKSIGNGLLDHRAADGEAVHATPIDEVFAGAVITGSRVAAAIVNVRTAATVPATNDPLQQR